MKKRFLLIFFMIACGVNAWAAYSGDGWSLSDDGVLTVTTNDATYDTPWIRWQKYTDLRGEVKSIIIGDNVSAISSSAFSGCTKATSVTIGKSVKSIGVFAFSNCYKLTSITIPKNVTSIDMGIFSGCVNLEEIIVDPENTTFVSIDGVLYNKTGKTLVSASMVKEEIVVPEWVTAIGDYAFNGSSVKSIVLPDGIETVGMNAFSQARSLESINLPSIVTIYSSAFNECNSLKSVTFGNSLKNIYSNAFKNCWNLINVNIPSSTNKIADDAFTGVRNIIWEGHSTSNTYGAYSINGIVDGDFVYKDDTKETIYSYIGSSKEVVIPSTVKYINDGAFSHCDNLTSVTIPNTILSIRTEAFGNCSDIVSLTIPNSVTYVGSNAFYFVKNIIYSGNLKPSGNGAWGALTINGIINGDFIYSSGVQSMLTAYIGSGGDVVVPEGTTSINGHAFENCANITSVRLPSSVTGIYSYAFAGCAKMNWINIPKSVTTIANYAFERSPKATIYCEIKASSKPSDWSYNWSTGCKKVVWGQSVIVANLSVLSNNPEWGFAGPSGSYVKGTEVLIEASAFEVLKGSKFVGWSDGNTDNPRVITVNEDMEITAIFEVEGGQGGNGNQSSNEGGQQGGNEQGGENNGNENQGGEQGGNNTNPPTSVSESAANNLQVYAHHNTIIVENATEEIRVYNAMGALVGRDVACRVRAELQVNGAGVYIVKVGNVAKRVMVY